METYMLAYLFAMFIIIWIIVATTNLAAVQILAILMILVQSFLIQYYAQELAAKP